jgi:hypothetical protein
LLIQKQQRAQCLILGRSRDMLLRCEMGQEIRNLCLTQIARMTFAVEENETADPIEVSLLGTQAVAARPHESAHLLQQFRLAAGIGLGLHKG